MTATQHAEIAGAGIAGLAVATALAQRGWTVRVHERFPEVRALVLEDASGIRANLSSELTASAPACGDRCRSAGSPAEGSIWTWRASGT